MTWNDLWVCFSTVITRSGIRIESHCTVEVCDISQRIFLPEIFLTWETCLGYESHHFKLAEKKWRTFKAMIFFLASSYQQKNIFFLLDCCLWPRKILSYLLTVRLCWHFAIFPILFTDNSSSQKTWATKILSFEQLKYFLSILMIKQIFLSYSLI